jgi:hypothetical protein
VEQQNEFAWQKYIVFFHVGQMLFAGNKYLLLKKITDQFSHNTLYGNNGVENFRR